MGALGVGCRKAPVVECIYTRLSISLCRVAGVKASEVLVARLGERFLEKPWVRDFDLFLHHGWLNLGHLQHLLTLSFPGRMPEHLGE